MQILAVALAALVSQSHVIFAVTPHLFLKVFAVAGCNCISPQEGGTLPDLAEALQDDSLNMMARIKDAVLTPDIDT